MSNPEAFELLRQRTLTVWLEATPEDHWQRVLQQGDLRPMQNRPHAMLELRRRLSEREPLHALAEITCSTSERTVEDIVQALAARLLSVTARP